MTNLLVCARCSSWSPSPSARRARSRTRPRTAGSPATHTTERAGPGRSPLPAAWRCAAVLLRRWTPGSSPCRGSSVRCSRFYRWPTTAGPHARVSACVVVCGCLRVGVTLVDVRLDVVPLPPRSSSPTVAGCHLGGDPVGRDQWGGERVVGVLPRINIGTDVWVESSIMTGVYERWCSSTLHIGWDLCDSLCLVLVCGGK